MDSRRHQRQKPNVEERDPEDQKHSYKELRAIDLFDGAQLFLTLKVPDCGCEDRQARLSIFTDIGRADLYERCRAIARNANTGRIAGARQREAIRDFHTMWRLQKRRLGAFIRKFARNRQSKKCSKIYRISLHEQQKMCYI